MGPPASLAFVEVRVDRRRWSDVFFSELESSTIGLVTGDTVDQDRLCLLCFNCLPMTHHLFLLPTPTSYIYPFPRWRPQLGAKSMNISIKCTCKHSELYSNLEYLKCRRHC